MLRRGGKRVYWTSFGWREGQSLANTTFLYGNRLSFYDFHSGHNHWVKYLHLFIYIYIYISFLKDNLIMKFLKDLFILKVGGLNFITCNIINI